MSVSSKIRKESTESNAAQAMHSPMGLHPEQGLAQLNDKGLENELPSRVADSNDTDVPGDVAEADSLIAEADDDMSSATIEESKRASWGQPPVSTDQDNPDWNTNTTDQTVPATRANEPERTLGNA